MVLHLIVSMVLVLGSSLVHGQLRPDQLADPPAHGEGTFSLSNGNPYETNSGAYNVGQNPTDESLLMTVHKAYDALSDIEKGLVVSTCDRSTKHDHRKVASTLQDLHGQSFEVDTISFEYAEELFADFARERRIPFGFPDDGCYARAHAMTRMFQRRGISTGKVFIHGDLQVATNKHPNGFVMWGYHVAPIVMVRRNGEVKPYVFDPSLFNEPVPVERWYTTQTSHRFARIDRTYMTNQYQMYPASSFTPIKNSYLKSDNELMNGTMKAFVELQRRRAAGEVVNESDTRKVYDKMNK